MFKNKKVLLVGLGILGGGLSTAKFLLQQGAKLTITDLKNKKILSSAINRLKNKKIKFVLGKHRKIDFRNNEIIVFNPAVSIFSPWVKLAKKYKKPIENDLTLFLKMLDFRYPTSQHIAVTGTRGKTTIATWLNHFLSNSILGGNIPEKGLLKIVNKKTKLFILETSSFQLEFMRRGLKAPKVAIITNLYNDHLNRYGTFKNYLNQKAKIFLNQIKNDFLILNADNKYTKDFLKKRPKSKIYYFSLNRLPSHKNGIFFEKQKIYFQDDGKKRHIRTLVDLANHQKTNLLASLLGAYLYCRDWGKLIKKIKTLPEIHFRQEIIFKNKDLTIINDTSATSPEATIVALERFSPLKKPLILITGGTDKNLEFRQLADRIKKYTPKENLYLLKGTATKKLLKQLRNKGYSIFDDLEEIILNIKKYKKRGTILFSPASASFEKFKNEFDRGRQFNYLIKKYFKS